MKYYTCANTSAGLWNFTVDNISDVENLVNLNSRNIHFVDAVLRSFCSELCEEYDEIIAPGTQNLRQGIISKKRSFAIISDRYADENTVMPEKMETAYREAKKIHDDWEKIYIGNMNFEKLNSYCQNIIDNLVTQKSNEGQSKLYKRFFGTTTPVGAVNFIDDITFDLSERYFIKGRPGTGKSTFLKKLSSALVEKGFDIEQYYCSFDPKSLDMVVSRELSFCVFDSTAPHEKFPERDSDVILDFYAESGLVGIDEKYQNELELIQNAYVAKIREGNEALVAALKEKNSEEIEEMSRINDKDIMLAVENLKKMTER